LGFSKGKMAGRVGPIDFAILLAPVDGVIEKGEKGGRIGFI
jgi:hypothetical protein